MTLVVLTTIRVYDSLFAARLDRIHFAPTKTKAVASITAATKFADLFIVILPVPKQPGGSLTIFLTLLPYRSPLT